MKEQEQQQKHPEWVIDPKEFAVWQAQNDSRRVNVLVAPETCGATDIAAGMFWLHPGHETQLDIHPESAEIYYVIGGEGRLVMDEEEFRVKKGMTVYIPAGVSHQSFNEGTEDLCYFYAFAPPPPGPAKQQEQGWKRMEYR